MENNRLFEVELIRFGEYCEENETIWISQDISLELVMDAIQFCLDLPQWNITWTAIEVREVRRGK